MAQVRFVVGRGNNRTEFAREDKGKAHHEQRRDFKRYIGLIQ
jgi:hypothetical protein